MDAIKYQCAPRNVKSCWKILLDIASSNQEVLTRTDQDAVGNIQRTYMCILHNPAAGIHTRHNGVVSTDFVPGRGLTFRMTRRYIRNSYAPGADTSQVLHSNAGKMKIKSSERLTSCRASRASRRQRYRLVYIDRLPHFPPNHQHCCRSRVPSILVPIIARKRGARQQDTSTPRRTQIG
jgi:hypothetical protein